MKYTGRTKFRFLTDILFGDWNPEKVAVLCGVSVDWAKRMMSDIEKKQYERLRAKFEGKK